MACALACVWCVSVGVCVGGLGGLVVRVKVCVCVSGCCGGVWCVMDVGCHGLSVVCSFV